MTNALGAAAEQLTCDLVAIDSVNPGLVPGAAGERNAVALLQQRLDAAGFHTEIFGSAERPSLVAIYDGGPGRSVVLNGHLDTVGVDGMPEPFAARIEGTKLIGRGTSDMKGGVAGMVVAAEALAAQGVAGRIVLALVADEEDASIGTEELIAHGVTGDVCIVGEPSWMNIAVAHRGFAVTKVSITGKAAHSSQPQHAVDAIAGLGRLITAVHAANDALSKAQPHQYLEPAAFAVTVVNGGSAPFTIAAHADAIVEKRTLPGETGESVVAEVQAMLDDIATLDSSFDARVELVMARDAWEVVEDSAASELIGCLQRQQPADRVGAPYWMESALWDAAGVPSVVFGPAGGGMHAINEWVELDQLHAYPVILVDAIREFLGAA